MAPAANRKPALSRRETALRALLYPRRFLVDAEFELSIREGLNQQGVAKLVLNRALPTHFARCSAENSSGHGETRAIESAGPSIASGEHRSARPGGAGDDGRDGLATPRGHPDGILPAELRIACVTTRKATFPGPRDHCRAGTPCWRPKAWSGRLQRDAVKAHMLSGDSTGEGLSRRSHTPISAPRSEMRSRPWTLKLNALAFFV